MSLLVLASCSKVDRFESNTKSLDRTTQEMSAQAESIEKIALALYPQMRSGDTVRIRNEEWDILTDKNKKLGQKMVAAGIYFQSLEYQFWTANNASDNKLMLDLMYRDAADEFQGRMFDLYREINRKKMSPSKEGKRQNEEMAFYALAMTMDRSHHYQVNLAAKYPNIKFQSFQDIIKEALLKEKDGSPLESHELILLSGMNKEIITELLKARVDILAALALKDLVELRDMGISEYSKAAVFKITRGRMGSIDIPETYGGSNTPTKITVMNYLDSALKTKAFLGELGLGQPLEKTIRSAFSKIDLNQVGDDQKVDLVRIEILNKIKMLMK